MRVGLTCIASLAAAGALVTAVSSAPMAAAATSKGASGDGGSANSSKTAQPHQSCVSLGGTQSQCQSPGNAEVYDAPPQVAYFPYAGGGT